MNTRRSAEPGRPGKAAKAGRGVFRKAESTRTDGYLACHHAMDYPALTKAAG